MVKRTECEIEHIVLAFRDLLFAYLAVLLDIVPF
jgi:hypothetical protein